MPISFTITVQDADVPVVAAFQQFYADDWAAAQTAGTTAGVFTKAAIVKYLTAMVKAQRDAGILAQIQATAKTQSDAQQAIPPPPIT